MPPTMLGLISKSTIVRVGEDIKTFIPSRHCVFKPNKFFFGIVFNIKGIPLILKTIPKKNLFGLKTQWRDGIKVLMSSPTRTIVDLLINPNIVGGIRNVVDVLINYLKSDFKNLKMLVNYLKLINNSAAFKRLGFLMEEYAPKEKQIIQLCNQFCTISKTKLDPKLTSKKFVTRWRLWVPKNWEKQYDKKTRNNGFLEKT